MLLLQSCLFHNKEKKTPYWSNISVECCMLVGAASHTKCAPSRDLGIYTDCKSQNRLKTQVLLQLWAPTKKALLDSYRMKTGLRFHSFSTKTNSQSVYRNIHFILQHIFYAITLQHKHCLLHAGLCVRLRHVSAKKQSPLSFSVITVSKGNYWTSLVSFKSGFRSALLFPSFQAIH